MRAILIAVAVFVLSWPAMAQSRGRYHMPANPVLKRAVDAQPKLKLPRIPTVKAPRSYGQEAKRKY